MTVACSRRIGLGLLPLLLLVGACGGAPAADAVVETPVINVAADNAVVVDSGIIESGPLLSGNLAAERTAELRAQVAGTLLDVLVREGTAVTAGQPLARIEATVLEDQVRSAASMLQSAEANAELATRNAERAVRLHGAGAMAERDLEAARSQAAAATAMAADARARLASARQQLAHATVRAPFAGVVSERRASAGDVLAMGTPILTMVDPTRLELAASVPAAALNTIRRGAKVEFSVTGYPGRSFVGTIARVNPVVDPATRQVRTYVSVPNADRALASGLFAEGRVAVEQVRALAIPLSAIDPTATTPSVRRLAGGKVELVEVTLGVRDDVTERVQILSGVARGDTLLVGAALGTPAGSLVRIAHADR